MGVVIRCGLAAGIFVACLCACDGDDAPPIALPGARGDFEAPDTSVCPSHTRTAEDAIQATLDGFDSSCASDEDCVGVSIDTDCSAACGAVVAADEQPALLDAIADQNAGNCAAFLEAGCVRFVPGCPLLPGGPACVAGVCTLSQGPVGTDPTASPGGDGDATGDGDGDGDTSGDGDGDGFDDDEDRDADGGAGSTCIGEPLEFGPDGGFVAWLDAHTLAPCADFSTVRTSFGVPGSDASCANTVADDAPINAGDVARALDRADVQAAFASAPMLFGRDTRPADGQVFRIEHVGAAIEVGSACMAAAGCAEIPTGVETLRTLLVQLITQQHALPDCDAL